MWPGGSHRQRPTAPTAHWQTLTARASHWRALLLLLRCGMAPGGITSNLLTYWVNGNVALSVSMSVASGLCCLFMIPALYALYIVAGTPAHTRPRTAQRIPSTASHACSPRPQASV